MPSVEELAATTVSAKLVTAGRPECCPIALRLTTRLTASAALSTQVQSPSRRVLSSRKKRTRWSQAHTPPIRSKSPKKLCIGAGEKSAESDAAARNATRDQKIGSLRRSSVFRPKQSARTSAAAPTSTTTRKKMFRGTTYGKKKSDATISGTASDASSTAMTAVRHESSGNRTVEIRTGQLVVASVRRFSTSGMTSCPPSNLMVVCGTRSSRNRAS